MSKEAPHIGYIITFQDGKNNKVRIVGEKEEVNKL